MRRFVPWILLAASVAIVVVALVELGARETEGDIAAPSPTFTVAPGETPPVTMRPPAATVAPTGQAGQQVGTPAPGTPPGGQTGTQQGTPAPTFVPATPAPGTPAPVTGDIQATGPTPVTGGGAFAGGLLVLGFAAALARLSW